MPHRIERKTSAHMKQRSRELRRAAPVPERILWSILRGRRLGGFKFRRQQPIGPYVADFLCEPAKLIVELDGRSHEDSEEADAARDAYMRGRGLRVLRIPNDELLRRREDMVETILRELELGPPAPQGEGSRPSP